MSYLIDALKKAERDRHARREANLRSAAATDAPTRRGRGLRIVAVVVLALVVVNVVLLFRLWGPTERDNASPAVSQSSQSMGRPDKASGAEAVKKIVASHGQGEEEQPARQAPAQTAQHASSTPRVAGGDMSDNRDLGSLRLSPAPNPESVTPATPASQGGGKNTDDHAPVRRPAENGSVTYSKTPLSNDSSLPAGNPVTTTDGSQPAAPDENLPNQAQISGAPQIDINGQLYSSVPGRSFILVDGRRYHEGEKLPEGPAIESITPTGATMRYRGKRYHVSGPGGG